MKREVIIELQLQDQGAVAALGKLEIETKTYQKELRTLNAEIQKNGQATLEQTQRVGELNAMIRRNQGEVREMKNDLSGLTAAGLRFRDKMADASLEALKQSGILGKLEVSAQKLAAEFKAGTITQAQFEKGIRDINAQIGQQGKFFAQGVTDLKNYALGFFGVVAAAQAVMAVFGNVTRIIAEFDAAQSNLAAILGTTKEGVSALTEEAKQYGSVTQFTAAQVTELQTELAKLGFTQQQIQQSTKAVLDLAAATGTDLGNAATIAAQTLNAFGLGAEETARVVDVIAESANQSAFDIDTFSAAMSNAAPAAKAVGVSIEETTALLSALVDAGIPAEKAGTDLRNIFISLAEKGLTLDEAYGKIKGSTDQLTTAVGLFDQRAAGSALILADNTEKVDRLEQAYLNAAGAAGEMAQTQLDNIQGDKLLLQSAWEGFVLSIEDGSGVIGKAWRGMLTVLTQILEAISDVSDKPLEDFTAQVEAAAKAAGDMRDIQLDSTAAQEIIEGYQRQADSLKDYGTSLGEISLQEEQLGKLRARLAELSGKELTSRGKIEREAVRVAIQRFEANIKEAKAANEKAKVQAELTEEERKAAEEAKKAAADADAASKANARRSESVRVLTKAMRDFQALQKQVESGEAITQLAPSETEATPITPVAEGLLGPTQAANAALAESTNQEADVFISAQEAKIVATQELANALGGIASLMGEQTAAGKAFATTQALINTYLGVTQVLANKTTLPEPFGTAQKTLAVAGTIAAGLAAVRRIQGFAEGGQIRQSDGPRYTANPGDSVLISAAPGEVILTREQQRRLKALAGHTVFGDIGVPGFDRGGLVRGTALVNLPRQVPSGTVAQADLTRALRGLNISPVVRVTDVMDVMGAVKVSQDASSL